MSLSYRVDNLFAVGMSPEPLQIRTFHLAQSSSHAAALARSAAFVVAKSINPLAVLALQVWVDAPGVTQERAPAVRIGSRWKPIHSTR